MLLVLRSFVIRLVCELPAGEVAGEVEVVESGHRTAVRNVEELLAVLGVLPPPAAPPADPAPAG